MLLYEFPNALLKISASGVLVDPTYQTYKPAADTIAINLKIYKIEEGHKLIYDECNYINTRLLDFYDERPLSDWEKIRLKYKIKEEDFYYYEKKKKFYLFGEYIDAKKVIRGWILSGIKESKELMVYGNLIIKKNGGPWLS
jgi:hypothetical protein